MQVDRTRFLLLTAVIAAGCGAARQQATDQMNATGPDFDTTQGGSPPRQLLATGQRQPPPPEIVTPPPEEPVVPAPTVERVPAEAEPPAVPATNDPVEPRLAKICDSIRAPDPGCEGFSATAAACYRYGRVMEPKAAGAAAKASCQAALSGYKLSVQMALVSCITQVCELTPCLNRVGR